MIIQTYATMVRRIHITGSENRFNFRAAKGQLLWQFFVKIMVFKGIKNRKKVQRRWDLNPQSKWRKAFKSSD